MVTLQQTTAVPDAPQRQDAALYRTFNRSVVVSGLRCVLTYLLLPYVTPLIGLSGGVGPVLGLTLGVVAIAANVFTIRRFWQARHRWRWLVTAVSTAAIALLVLMAGRDLAVLVS